MRNYVPAPLPSADRYPADSKCGTGVVLCLDVDNTELLMIPTLCHRWLCPRCGPLRAAKARALAAFGKPDKRLTLTTRPRKGLSTKAAVKWIRGRWTALLRRLRRNYPRMEYLSFLEFHDSGWPHLHILMRGCYVPQRQLSAWWKHLTGDFKVYIQGVGNTWKAIQEATKYVLKTAAKVHEACPSVPVYTKSKGWVPADWDQHDRPPGNYKLYAFARLPWADSLELLEELGVEVRPSADAPGKYTLARDGPIPAALTDHVYDIGTWPEKELMAAVDLFFADPVRACADVEDLKAKQEFYASGPDQMPDYFEPYTRPPEISPAPELQHQRPLFQQTPAPTALW